MTPSDRFSASTDWFELFECARKSCLVGLPVFFDPGSASQLILGLLVCFISSTIYAMYTPYSQTKNNRLALVCQISLFFSLASSIALKMDPVAAQSGPLSTLLIMSLAMPFVTMIVQECWGDRPPPKPKAGFAVDAVRPPPKPETGLADDAAVSRDGGAKGPSQRRQRAQPSIPRGGALEASSAPYYGDQYSS